MTGHPISLVRFTDPRSHCTTCHASARWMVNGTVTCDDHIALWALVHSDRAEFAAITVGGR